MTKEKIARQPSISVVIPTYNSGGVLGNCLRSIAGQNYPKNKIEIILADGGSSDDTFSVIAKIKNQSASRRTKIKIKVLPNPLKTAESGKAIGVKAAKNELMALIDSDNILPQNDWFKRLVEPFEDPGIIGSEPWSYTWRGQDGFITRYSALLGMNDPLVHFTGNYDRLNGITGRWTDVSHTEEDRGGWLKVKFDPKMIPTIGANGTLLRRQPIAKILGKRDYFFDIDILWELMQKNPPIAFAKVKVGIIHLYCSSSIGAFVQKQKRRVKDFLYYQKLGVRQYPWNKIQTKTLVRFGIYSLLLLPTFLQALKGFIKKPDLAWFFHPLACWLTFWLYFWGKLLAILFQPQLADRSSWKQINR